MQNSIIHMPLDLTRTQHQWQIECIRGNTAREIHLRLHTKGIPFIITSDVHAVMIIKKPDNTTVINDCMLKVGESEVVYELSSQAVSATGLCSCQLQLSNGVKTIAAPVFGMYVSTRNLSYSGSVSKDDLESLVNAIAQAENIDCRIENRVIDGKTSPVLVATDRYGNETTAAIVGNAGGDIPSVTSSNVVDFDPSVRGYSDSTVVGIGEYNLDISEGTYLFDNCTLIGGTFKTNAFDGTQTKPIMSLKGTTSVIGAKFVANSRDKIPAIYAENEEGINSGSVSIPSYVNLSGNTSNVTAFSIYNADNVNVIGCEFDNVIPARINTSGRVLFEGNNIYNTPMVVWATDSTVYFNDNVITVPSDAPNYFYHIIYVNGNTVCYLNNNDVTIEADNPYWAIYHSMTAGNNTTYQEIYDSGSVYRGNFNHVSDSRLSKIYSNGCSYGRCNNLFSNNGNGLDIAFDNCHFEQISGVPEDKATQRTDNIHVFSNCIINSNTHLPARCEYRSCKISVDTSSSGWLLNNTNLYDCEVDVLSSVTDRIFASSGTNVVLNIVGNRINYTERENNTDESYGQIRCNSMAGKCCYNVIINARGGNLGRMVHATSGQSENVAYNVINGIYEQQSVGGDGGLTNAQVQTMIDESVSTINEGLLELINSTNNLLKVVAYENDSVYDNEYKAWCEANGVVWTPKEEGGDTPVTPPVDDPTPTKTLTSITVTWSAESADVGTNPSTLITSVKANYSDGTSQSVTGYTVSPASLVDGAQTVTVSYNGKTSTKSITGNAVSQPDKPDVVSVKSVAIQSDDNTNIGGSGDNNAHRYIITGVKAGDIIRTNFNSNNPFRFTSERQDSNNTNEFNYGTANYGGFKKNYDYRERYVIVDKDYNYCYIASLQSRVASDDDEVIWEKS